MKRLRMPGLATHWAVLAAAVCSGIAMAFEGAITAQDLMNVKASEQVVAASWAQRPEGYVLRLLLDQSRAASRSARATSTAPVRTAEATEATVASALAQLAAPTQAAAPPGDSSSAVTVRESFFIGNTLANLRGLDPTFCGRTLTIVDGRRPDPAPPQPESADQPAQPELVGQPYSRAVKMPTVEVWLLRVDGTVIRPATYNCDVGTAAAPRPDKLMEILYGYHAADGARADAVAIRIDQDYFIEKLQLPPARPAAQ